MAVAKIVPTKVGLNSPAVFPTTTLIGADGMEVDFTGSDSKVLIYVDSTAAATIKAGNGIQGTADLAVAAGKCVTVESGKYKNISGAHKGSVYITGATAKVAAVELP